MHTRFMLSVLTLTLLTGCPSTDKDTGGDSGFNPDADADTDTDTDTDTEFLAARALWESGPVGNYVYTLQWSCFCPDEYVQAAEIVVREASVTSATYVSDGSPVVEGFDALTIDELFDLVWDSYTRDALVFVEYDPTVGFPTAASFDYYPDMAHDELAFTASDLAAFTE